MIGKPPTFGLSSSYLFNSTLVPNHRIGVPDVKALWGETVHLAAIRRRHLGHGGRNRTLRTRGTEDGQFSWAPPEPKGPMRMGPHPLCLWASSRVHGKNLE